MISRLSTIPVPEQLGENIAARLIEGILRLEMVNISTLMGDSLDGLIRSATAGTGSEGVALAARILDGEDYHRLLARELYRGREAWQLPVPPITLQIASLKDLEIYTLNFDPLLELALLRVRELSLMIPGVDAHGWRSYRTEWPVSNPKASISPRAGVHHVNGWIDPDGTSSSELVLTAADFINRFGDSSSLGRVCLQQLFEADGALLMLGIEPGSDAMRRLLSCFPVPPKNAVYTILTEGENGPAAWFQNQILGVYGIKTLWTETPEDTEVILRDVKFGLPVAGAAPQWIKQSLAWRKKELPDEEIFDDGWQAFAHTALQALIKQLETLFPADARETVQSSILFPIESKNGPELQIVAASQTRRRGAEAKKLAADFALSIRAGNEQGLSGLAFTKAYPMESADLDETERNFTPQMKENWYRDLGYKAWRSLLSVPVLDSDAWVPVAVITLTSNLTSPFWNNIGSGQETGPAELFAAMRRTAKVLLSEYKSKTSFQKAMKTPLVDSSDPALLSTQISRAVTGAALLQNYHGYLNVRLNDNAGERRMLFISFTPAEPSPNATESALINIADGLDAAEVEFHIECVSPSLKVVPKQVDVLVSPNEASGEVMIECIGTTSRSARLFVQVFQKSRIIQVLRMELQPLKV
jgi:hypothetical protein